MKLDKAEQQWDDFVEERFEKYRDAIEKYPEQEKSFFHIGVQFVESNLSQVPKVRELLETLKHIKASAYMGIGLHKNEGLSLDELEKGLNNIILEIDEALSKFNK